MLPPTSPFPVVNLLFYTASAPKCTSGSNKVNLLDVTLVYGWLKSVNKFGKGSTTKMLERRPEDALVKLLKTVEIVETVETVETVKTVETVETEETVETVQTVGTVETVETEETEESIETEKTEETGETGH